MVPAGPYVYALVDPRDSSVFYVGKGTGRRMYQHEREVMRGKVSNAAKASRIAEILAAGLRVACKVLAVFGNDAAAFKAERAFIAEHAGLTNANAGGGGSVAVYTEGGTQEGPKQPAADIGEALQLALDAYKEMSESQPGESAYKAAFSRDTTSKQREAAPGEAAAARRY